MKALLLLLFNCSIFFGFSQNKSNTNSELSTILKQTSTVLNNISSLSYNHTRELNFASNEYYNISNWECYYQFEPTKASIDFKYQIKELDLIDFYNGTERFYLNESTKHITINNGPKEQFFNSLSFLYNSPITLKNVLPLLTQDKILVSSLSDTIIKNQVYYLVTFNLRNQRIQSLGKGFDLMKTPYDFIYKIVINKSNYLPLEIWQGNNHNSDFIKTTFTAIDLNPTEPTENSWYYSSYLSEYNNATATPKKRIANNTLAPKWKLPYTNSTDSMSSQDLNGKVVLLYFWIRNCGACIQSAPLLNALKQKFDTKDFVLLGINSNDTADEINRFVSRHGINYQTLYNGTKVEEEFGVSSFPTLFLIDKSGRVNYSQTGLSEESTIKLEEMIKSLL